MNGYQITFLTVEGHTHKGKPTGHWLIDLARGMGLPGATLMPGLEGFGGHRRIHSAHFFELTDRPIEIVMALTEEQAEQLFARLREEKVHLFYVKTAVEFGVLGEEGA